ncbi:MAG: DUF2235 domain-containing protein [Proteobacteria bacterium]|nr:DUF2235 domain-containing protein [Pseudomonadota bacterium]
MQASNGARNLVFVSDGTLSTLRPGAETNAGLLYRLLEEIGRHPWQQFDYDPGVQGSGLAKWFNAITGMGINLAICQGYSFLASRYRPGDRIYLFGYSRGAYAVRSLAGMIGAVGLLRREQATQRNIRRAFRLYERDGSDAAKASFIARRCHGAIRIEMVGVWDTVKTLGLPYPVLSRLGQMATGFHDHALGPHFGHGYHALAIDEDRTAFAPILWQRSARWQGRLEQAWFPGAHADVGGDIGSIAEARPLANIPLNWMLLRAARHGLVLPEGWEARFPEDPAAVQIGNRRGIARLFLWRRPRATGGGDGETIHLSIRDRMAALPGYRPVGSIDGG